MAALISITSNITEAQIKGTVETARLGEWDVIHFIPESIATALAYVSTVNIPKIPNAMIVNFGGGILDICIANVLKSQMKILSSCGFENPNNNIKHQFKSK